MAYARAWSQTQVQDDSDCYRSAVATDGKVLLGAISRSEMTYNSRDGFHAEYARLLLVPDLEPALLALFLSCQCRLAGLGRAGAAGLGATTVCHD